MVQYKAEHGLYSLEHALKYNNNSLCNVYAFLNVVPSNIVQQLFLWHKRLAHPFDIILEKLDRASLLGFVYNMYNKTMYIVCPLAKAHILPFVSTHVIAISLFDLLNFDLLTSPKLVTIGAR